MSASELHKALQRARMKAETDAKKAQEKIKANGKEKDETIPTVSKKQVGDASSEDAKSSVKKETKSKTSTNVHSGNT